nr:hypothetical protein [Tanacetum cinerariifolium]
DDRDLAVEYEKTIENESKVSKIIIEKRESSDVGNITKASNLEDESELGEGGEKLDKNTTLQACDFHSDAFTKSALKVEFLIKVVTSHVMEKASEITPDTVRLEERRRHNSQQREARGRFGGLTMSENLSDAVGTDFLYIQTLFFIFYDGKWEETYENYFVDTLVDF